MTLDKKRLKELSYEIKDFITNSFEYEKGDEELDFFLNDFLEPAVELAVDNYLSFKKRQTEEDKDDC